LAATIATDTCSDLDCNAAGIEMFNCTSQFEVRTDSVSTSIRSNAAIDNSLP